MPVIHSQTAVLGDTSASSACQLEEKVKRGRHIEGYKIADV
jgi:hypothetical protein